MMQLDSVVLGTCVEHTPESLGMGELDLERMEIEFGGTFKCREASETIMLKDWHLWGRW